MFLTLPAVLLRAEGAILLGAATLLYWDVSGTWLLFALTFFVPDLAIAGYLAGPHIGALAYNAFHTTSLAMAVAVFGVIADQRLAVLIGLIWLAHIGFDRLLGYGLKYPEGFRHTHLSRA